MLVLMSASLVPPNEASRLGEERLKSAPWRTEHDVLGAIESLGHEAKGLGIAGDVSPIRDAAAQWRPHVAFNLLEDFDGTALYDQNVVSYLELIGLPYTGCNPRGMVLARDKAVSKKLLAYHGIRVPGFAVFPPGRRVRRPEGLEFPLFVKSLLEDASLGISRASLVRGDKALAARAAFVHRHTGLDAIAEEYIAGRELYVGLIGNERPEALPIWEFSCSKKPPAMPLIATARMKWNLAHQKRWGIISAAAEGLPPGTSRRMDKLSKLAYRVLGLSGYARMDFRLAPDGSLYFLEANPNPQLARGEDFADSAMEKGISYERLLARIIGLGLRRKPAPD